MKSTRKDYQLDRNQEIYEEYINSDSSYNKLAKKYDLTPQRIQAIIKEAKNKGIGKTLSLNAKENEVYIFRDLAIETRERGNYEQSIDMFSQVANWYENQKEFRGLDGIYGHLAIAYQKVASNSKTNSEKIENYNLAEVCLNKSYKISKQGKTTDRAFCITNIHLAKNKLLKSQFLKNSEKEDELKEALKLVDDVVPIFPGSEAHKAWPLNVKSQVLFALGLYNEAYATAQKAESYIFTGYDSEMNWGDFRKVGRKGHIGNDQAAMKFQIWLTSVHLTMATICKELGKDVLASYYAYSITGMKDETGNLVSVKSKAKKLLNEL